MKKRRQKRLLPGGVPWGATGAAAGLRPGSIKEGRSPSQWREEFERVVERDQCLPGAIHAALKCADAIFGTRASSLTSIQDLNTLLGYKKGFACGTNATTFQPFTRRLETQGLKWTESKEREKAYQHLVDIVASVELSFPVVAVDLNFIRQYDPRTKFVGNPQNNDHAVLILAISDTQVEFFDPTRQRDETSSDIERMGTADFLGFWGNNPIEPFYRGWISRRAATVAPRASRGRPKGVRSLESFQPRERRH